MPRKELTYQDYNGWGARIESLYQIYEKFNLPFDENLKGDFIIDCVFGGLKREDTTRLNNIVLETKGIAIKNLSFDDDTNISRFFNYCRKNEIFNINPEWEEMSMYIADNEYQLTLKHQRELKLGEILD
jgi:hypothetical protein